MGFQQYVKIGLDEVGDDQLAVAVYDFLLKELKGSMLQGFSIGSMARGRNLYHGVRVRVPRDLECGFFVQVFGAEVEVSMYRGEAMRLAWEGDLSDPGCLGFVVDFVSKEEIPRVRWL